MPDRQPEEMADNELVEMSVSIWRRVRSASVDLDKLTRELERRITERQKGMR